MNTRKLVLFILSICAALAVNAGNSKSTSESKDFKTIPSRTDFGSYNVIDGSSADVVGAFISKQSSNLQSKTAGIVLDHNSASLAAYHYTFSQTYNGIPVFASAITVNVSKKNVVFSIFDGSYDMSAWKVNTTPFDYHQVGAYGKYVRDCFPSSATEEARQMIAFDEKMNAPQLCYYVTIRDRSKQLRELLVGRQGIIYERDGNMYFAAPDSTVSGMVFNPDPLTTAHVLYGGAYTNHNDSDVSVLNAQRQPVHFKADFDASSGVFSLSSPYVQLQSNTTPATSMTPDFSYTRAHSEFDDVMVFYHLNTFRSYLHGLGFNFGDVLVTCDPHGTTQDNSWFSQPSTLTFGSGSVPDPQDADVIVHEYTHFLSWNANGTNGFGASAERNSLDEGIADYDAASYSRSIDDFNWGFVYNFDGHNANVDYPGFGWDGRVVNDFTIYPAQPRTTASLNGIYRLCETWSSALMSVWNVLGRNVTDSLAYEAFYSYGQSTTLPEAAQLVIKADSMLYGGVHHCQLVYCFNLHGLAFDISNCGIHKVAINEVEDPMGATELISSAEKFRVILPQSDVNFTIDLYDMTGKKLSSYHNTTTDIKPELPNGVYIIDVSGNGGHKAFKWVMVR